MEFKPLEIAAIVLALAIPIGLFVLLLIPGAVDGIIAFVLQKDRMPFIFYGGAFAAFGFLSWRVYRRIIKPKARQTDAEDKLN